jgi:hypothetical protein
VMVGECREHIKQKDLFKIFRDYIKHEDNLTDKRLLWNNTIQGFLFAAYAVIVARVPSPLWNARLILIVISIVGLATSYLSWKGLLAAILAVHNLDHQWQMISGNDPRLPKLIGGGRLVGEGSEGTPKGIKRTKEEIEHYEKIAKWGFLAPRFFPIVFLGAWSLLLILSILAPSTKFEWLLS